MPGLIGYIKSSRSDGKAAISKGYDLLRYATWYQDDPIFEDNFIAAGRIHHGSLGERKTPVQIDGMYCWIEGEAYDLEEFRAEYSDANGCFSKLLIKAYQQNKLAEVLSKIDGYFVGKIYDSKRKRIFLFTDQLGMKPLYLLQDGKNIAWCSELKGLLVVPNFQAQIEQKALTALLDLGTLPSTLTWFKNVTLLTASTIVEIDVTDNKVLHKDYYWTWSAIQPKKMPFQEAKEKLRFLLEEAVQKRLNGNRTVSVALSGGLDSRSLLALSYQHRSINAFTFGQAESDDVRIAREVAKRTNVNYKFLSLQSDNWLKGRFTSVWKTDGMMPFNHLHYSVLHPEIKALGDIVLNGFAGDLTVGGSYMPKFAKPCDVAWLRKSMGQYADLYTADELQFLQNAPSDAFWLDWRVKRFTTNGSIDLGKLVESRKPFIDRELLAFLYSLPDNYRKYSRLYLAAMSMANVPIFSDIPWQQTGIPITKQWQTRQQLRFKIPQIKQRLGLNANYSFVDYPKWLRLEKSRTVFMKLLKPKEAIYSNYLDADFYATFYEPFLQKNTNVEQLFRAATIEVWLQWLFNKDDFISFQTKHDLL